MVLFNWHWPRLMNKLSLKRSQDLFVSEARISNDQSLLSSYNQVNDQTSLLV